MKTQTEDYKGWPGGEDYVVMRTRDSFAGDSFNGNWNDFPGSQNAGLICEQICAPGNQQYGLVKLQIYVGASDLLI